MAPLALFALFLFATASADHEIAFDYTPFFVLYKDGHITRLMGDDITPASLDPQTHVQSKDIVYSSRYNLSARIYIPKEHTIKDQKLPLVVYFHGGGFTFENAFSHGYHNFHNSLVSQANILSVSVDFRNAPENPLPCAYDDSWAALKWVASHANGEGPEDWLNSYADFQKVFLMGDSAGANIAHHMGIRHGQEKIDGVNVDGIILMFPYFWGKEPIAGETTDASERAKVDNLWRIAYPNTSGSDDPLINPVFDSKLSSLRCKRLLVFVAGEDMLRPRGLYYVAKLKQSGWKGQAAISDTPGEPHSFHLYNSTSENAAKLLRSTVCFIHNHGV